MVIGVVETYGRPTPRPSRRSRGDSTPAGRVPRRRRSRRWTSMRSSPAGRRCASSTNWRTPTRRAAAHEKRYQDVLALLDAGIDVMTAVNIQHLETLNDAVGRVDRRSGARDGARHVSRPRRRSGQRRRDGRGAAHAAARGQDLPARKGRAGAGELLPQGQPLDAARAGAARGCRRGRREGGGLSGSARAWSRR